jgi:hypothetical protein
VRENLFSKPGPGRRANSRSLSAAEDEHKHNKKISWSSFAPTSSLALHKMDSGEIILRAAQAQKFTPGASLQAAVGRNLAAPMFAKSLVGILEDSRHHR